METWLSLTPPIVTIILAFISRQVILSLFIGLLCGQMVLSGDNFQEYTDIFDLYIIGSIADKDHVYIILFSLFISGGISVMNSYSGMEGLLSPILKHVKSKKQALFTTYLSGLILFFDDYANTLVIGNTMRSISDHFKISREKLAYLVDSTSAPIAAIALVSTWIGAELSYIESALPASNEHIYQIFISSIPFAYYPILTLLFIPLLIHFDVDFGPMKQTVATTPEKTENSSAPFWSGLIPITLLISSMVTILYFSGVEEGDQTLSEIIGNSNSYTALLWSSFIFLIATICCSIVQKHLLKTSMEEVFKGFSHLLPTLAILIMAWALGSMIQDLKTSTFLISLIPDNFSPLYLPLTVFLFASLISFSTGSSWGTMAIVYPLAIPLALDFTDIDSSIFLASLASVLSGAVFGDHCSPISDTTILSSMATKCDHVQHVKTQIPYAVIVAIASSLCLVSPLNPAINILFFVFIAVISFNHFSDKKKTSSL